MAKMKSNADSSTITQGGIINIIASGTKITGELTVESDFRLDGEVEGDIIGKSKVVIGEKGHLKGSLRCTSAEIMGKVTGKTVIADCLTLRSTAVVVSDIQVKTLIVEPEATFNGACSMIETEKTVEQIVV